MDIDPWADIQSDRLASLIGCEEIDRFDAWIQPLHRWVIDHIFISQVARDMVTSEPKGPRAHCVANWDAHVEVCVDQFR